MFKEALSVALDLIATSGWALLVSFLAILAAGISYAVAKRRAAVLKNTLPPFDLLKHELEQVKRQISSGNSVDKALH